MHDRGLKAASVGALQHVDARIGAQRVRELAVADVDREDCGGPVLQQAVGEPSGRGADIERAAARDRDAGSRQGVLQLDPAARDGNRGARRR